MKFFQFEHRAIHNLRFSAFALLMASGLAQSSFGQCERQQVGSFLGNPLDVYGWSLDVQGDRAAASSIGDDYLCPSDPNCNAGSVNAFHWNGSAWQFDGRLQALDGAMGDEFGQDIDIDGDRMVIGAHRKGPGAAYVFERLTSGWVQQQKLVPVGAVAMDHVGHSVQIVGDTIFVGAMRDEHAGFESGALYVFESVGGNWVETRKLTTSQAGLGDRFGRDQVGREDMVVVGALRHDHLGTDSGAAFVFQRDDQGTPGDPLDDQWIETQTLHDDGGGPGDSFGNALAMQGDLLLIGAPQGSVSGVAQGYVTVFEYQHPNWVEVQTLVAGDGELDDRFGRSLAVDGDRVLVGAPGDDDNGSQAGAIYVFERFGGGPWTETQKFLPADGHPNASLGEEMSVGLSGSRALMGSRFHSLSANLTGSAYFVDVAGCVGTNFCTAERNSTGQASTLEASGSSLVVANNLTLRAKRLPPNQFGIFLVGQDPVTQVTPMVSQGNLCLATMIGRYNAVSQIRFSGTAGEFALTLDLIDTPSPIGPFSIQAGETWYFQAWYRDFEPGLGSVSNFTDGLEIEFH